MAENPVLIDPEVQATLAEVEAARRRLAESIGRLKQNRMLNPLDWRGWVERHPLECILGAAAVGFILAQPTHSGEDGMPSSVLGDVSRAGFESVLPLLIRTLL